VCPLQLSASQLRADSFSRPGGALGGEGSSLASLSSALSPSVAGLQRQGSCTRFNASLIHFYCISSYKIQGFLVVLLYTSSSSRTFYHSEDVVTSAGLTIGFHV
jgi:hypothetical protein